MNNFFKAFFVSFITAIILILFQNGNLYSVLDFFTSPFSSIYFFGLFLDKFSLLLIASVGSYWAISTNNYNLGGESQIYLGGFIASLILSFSSNNSFINILIFILGFLLSITAASLLMFVSAFLKHKKNINPLLSSFILSVLIIIIIDYFISNSFRDETKNLLATKSIANIFELKHFLLPSSFNLSIIISILFFTFTSLFFSKTNRGKQFYLTGQAPEFAKFRGIDTVKNDYISMLISGAFHGCCGFFAVIGTYYTCHLGFYEGMGWNAFTVALLAKSNPILLLPCSLLLAFYFTASDSAIISNIISSGSTYIIQAILLFVLALPLMWRKK